MRFPAKCLAAAVLVVVPCTGHAEAKRGGAYLAIFDDGRALPVIGAELVQGDVVRLDLGHGAFIEVSAGRLTRLVDATPAPEPDPPPPAACDPSWADEALPTGTPYASEIVAAARAENLNPWLVAAVVDNESRFDPMAVSPVGARGLMQLMPAVASAAGLGDPHDVRANLRTGSRYLRRLLDRYSDVGLALAAYNAGPATVDRYGGIPPYRETRGYVGRILRAFCPGTCADGSCENPYNALASAAGERAQARVGSEPPGGETSDGPSN